jgi:AcrR family transcriptional regulator
MAPLTRKERQAETRSCLMKSAAKIFARRGLQHASIDEVAQDAGYTKGAFYANFRSKEELFLAMLDDRFGQRLLELEQAIATDESPAEQARTAGDDFMRAVGSDPEWERLFLEFAAYAARNEEFREELVTRYRALRDRIAQLMESRLERLTYPAPVPPQIIALMTFAITNGVALEKLLEPDAVSDELLGQTLQIFFTGLTVMAREQARAPAH